jgi:hypothetical protein
MQIHASAARLMNPDARFRIDRFQILILKPFSRNERWEVHRKKGGSKLKSKPKRQADKEERIINNTAVVHKTTASDTQQVVLFSLFPCCPLLQ